MTATEAIEMLKREAKAEDGLYVGIALTRAEYAALLALLEGLRWRRFADELPPPGSKYLWYYNHGDADFCFVENDGLLLAGKSFDDAPDLWLPLSSILPGAA